MGRLLDQHLFLEYESSNIRNHEIELAQLCCISAREESFKELCIAPSKLGSE